MNVYVITPTKLGFEGVALVAAKNEQDAIELFKDEDERNPMYYDKGNCSCLRRENLYFSTTKPQVILDTVVHIEELY